jgi:hypothetical protein
MGGAEFLIWNVRPETAEAAPPLGFFKGGCFYFEKRPGPILFQKRKPSLGEILVSHLSAQDAERWGSLFLGEGEMAWDDILEASGLTGWSAGRGRTLAEALASTPAS